MPEAPPCKPHQLVFLLKRSMQKRAKENIKQMRVEMKERMILLSTLAKKKGDYSNSHWRWSELFLHNFAVWIQAPMSHYFFKASQPHVLCPFLHLNSHKAKGQNSSLTSNDDQQKWRQKLQFTRSSRKRFFSCSRRMASLMNVCIVVKTEFMVYFLHCSWCSGLNLMHGVMAIENDSKHYLKRKTFRLRLFREKINNLKSIFIKMIAYPT